MITKYLLQVFHYIEKRRFGSVLSSYYFRASILNPYVIYSLNENLLKGAKIFTPTLGWSSYAYGFSESPMVREYVGTDVIPDVCKKTDQLIADCIRKSKRYLLQTFRRFGKKQTILNKYENHFDVVFSVHLTINWNYTKERIKVPINTKLTKNGWRSIGMQLFNCVAKY